MSRASLAAVCKSPRISCRPLARCCLGVAGLVLVASPGFAADRSWGNTAGGTFSTSTNWINGLIAGVNDLAIFNRSRGTSQTTYTVSFSANAQNQSLLVGPDIVTFALGGRTYTTTAINGNEIGTAAAFSSQLTVQNGVFNMTGALTPTMLIGGGAGRVGSLVLTNNATLTGAPNLLIGTPSATGFLTLNGLSGGTATLSTLALGSGAGGRGSAGIDGPFAALTSSRLLVGDAGRGTLSMSTAATLTNNGTATIGNLAGSSGLVNVDGGTVHWNQAGSLLLGAAGAGTVNVLNGGSLLGQIAVLGSSTSGFGRLNIAGPGSKATFGNITIGDSGVGSVTVSDGAILARLLGSFTYIVGNNGAGFVDISSGSAWQNGGTTVLANGTNSTAQVNVRGLGSKWGPGNLLIGNRGDAAINITGGASVTSFDTATLGVNSTGAGRITVDGAGSSWRNFGTLVIGHGGFGTLRVTNGGRVENENEARIQGPGSSGLVEGQDSQWITGELTVNGSGSIEGQLTINAGGVVQSTRCGVPDTSGGGRASAIVSGANSRWSITNDLAVGFNNFNPTSASGSLTISTGALVEANSLLVGNNGTIIIDGGTLRVGVLSFRDTSVFNFNSGLLRINGNPTLSASFLDKLLGPAHTLPAGRQLSIGGVPTLTSSMVLDGGGLTISDITISGAGRLDLTDDTLVIDYTGATPVNNIRSLLTSGFAGGSWNGAGINSSIAASTPNRALGFAEATDIGSPSTFAGQPIDSTSILVRFTLPGDADLSAAVNLDDFTRLAANFGLASTWSSGDFNYDAITNLDDFTALAANFGLTLPAAAPARGGTDSAVPEPAMIVLALLPAILRTRRGRRC